MSYSSKRIPDILKTDFLVVGSGLAGLLATLKLAEAGASVVLACKGVLKDSNSSFAQGGVAASLPANQFDSPELHFEDTIRAGCGLVDETAAREVIFAGQSLIGDLANLGVGFDTDDNGVLSLSREGGHSRPRVLHNKDATGRSITSALIERLEERALFGRGDVIILENAFVQSLLLKDETCLGAQLALNGRSISVLAPQTILATGGLGQLYSRTTNPKVATGDGIALAYRAGASLIDMEFVQFHPTVLALAGAPAFLISEAVRGAGAALLDLNGERFMTRFHTDGELATRDVVARAMHSVMNSQNASCVLLDLKPIGVSRLCQQFPNIIATVRQFGIDPLTQEIPVSPAAHYFMGGIMTDLDGNTSVAGLSAIGECASIGLHGANRLASNSLLEAGVMATRAANYLLKKKHAFTSISNSAVNYSSSMPPYVVPSDLRVLKEKMYNNVGLVRNEVPLKETLAYLAADRTSRESLNQEEVEAANMHLLSGLISRAALLRRESRGAHCREDFALVDDQRYARRLIFCRSEHYWLDMDKKLHAVAKRPTKHLQTAGNA